MAELKKVETEFSSFNNGLDMQLKSLSEVVGRLQNVVNRVGFASPRNDKKTNADVATSPANELQQYSVLIGSLACMREELGYLISDLERMV